MPLYRWSIGAVAQLECKPSASGKVYAVLRAGSGDEDHRFAALSSALHKNQIAHFFASDNEQDTLIIPEAANDKQLLDILTSGGWVQGQPQVIPITADKKATQTQKTSHFIKDHPTLMAGIFYDLGSLSWIVSGIQRARHNRDGKFTKADLSEMMVGVVMALGNVLLTVYGHDKQKHPMLAFSDALSDHLKAQGIVLPAPDKATPEAIHQSGFFASANAFLEKNVVSTLALAKTAGGLLIAHAGTKKGNFNGAKTASGLLLAASWFGTFLLDKPDAPPYKLKPDHDARHTSTGGKLYDWVAENPRARLAATGASVTKITKIVGSIDEANQFHREARVAKQALQGLSGKALATAQKEFHYAGAKQYDYVWNLIGSAAFLIGNYMFATSGNKAQKKIEDFDQFRQEMLIVSANILTNIPDKARTQAIDETAHYMASIQDVTESQETIAKNIVDQIAYLQAHLHERTSDRAL